MLTELSHLLAYVQRYPWALLPETREIMVSILVRRMRGERLSESEVTERLLAAEAASPSRQRGRSSGGSVAVIPVWGVLSPRAHMVEDMSGPGGTSTEGLGAAIKEAVANPAVSGIVLDIHSPGGNVFGAQELFDLIYGARGSKQIVAVANSMAASCAYWLGCAAEEFVGAPGAQVGSIGVWTAHEDISKALEAEGIKVTLVSAGQYKTEGNAYGPLSDEARAAMQASVDLAYGMFTRSVAKGRGVPIDTVRKGYGRGRSVFDRDAVAEGMLDGIETLDQAIVRVGSGRRLAGKAPAVVSGSLDVVDPAPVPEPAALPLTPAAEIERLNAAMDIAGA